MPRTSFDISISQLKVNLLDYGARVERVIGESMESLKTRDRALAEAIIQNDALLNETRYELEDQCYTLLATQSPMAHDLRDIISILMVAIELERIADHAKNIAEITIYMGNEPLLKPLIDLPRMAELCQLMLTRALDSFAKQDADEAKAVAAMDDEIDNLYKQVFRELMSYIVEDPRTVTRAMNLLFAGHNLERIGDCITNIAERVVYAVTGRLEELNVQRQI
ncbi:MAG: phosphate signaling complex protein PhoU [Chloroflexota bacterium]|nr:MAG: phosphate signaling complex protein PhoU [Chloroflexota bacterium]